MSHSSKWGRNPASCCCCAHTHTHTHTCVTHTTGEHVHQCTPHVLQTIICVYTGGGNTRTHQTPNSWSFVSSREPAGLGTGSVGRDQSVPEMLSLAAGRELVMQTQSQLHSSIPPASHWSSLSLSSYLTAASANDLARGSAPFPIWTVSVCAAEADMVMAVCQPVSSTGSSTAHWLVYSWHKWHFFSNGVQHWSNCYY